MSKDTSGTPNARDHGAGLCWKEEPFPAIDHMAPPDPMIDPLRARSEQRDAEAKAAQPEQ